MDILNTALALGVITAAEYNDWRFSHETDSGEYVIRNIKTQERRKF
jgi:hypothetical protein